MPTAYESIVADMDGLANPAKAKLLSRFFKTGLGEYGEGDVFLGIMVPQQREVSMRYWQEARLEDVEKLLSSNIHEHRLVALLILVGKYEKTKSEKERKEIYEFYIAHASRINNWDLVDLSAPRIVGAYLLDKDRPILSKLSVSPNLWERRISILASFQFIKYGKFDTSLRLAETLLSDQEDLIHKAVGWMLREIGKRGGEQELFAFLDRHAKSMPRTMLRYAIERMDEKTRKKYMAIKKR